MAVPLFDTASTLAEETKNPQRNLPIGILGGLAICTVIYIVIGAVLTGMVPSKDLGTAADPTGAGDAFREGFLAGVCHGLGHEGAAQLGCAMAALVMETSGTQEYRFEPEEFLGRIAKSYGAGVTSDVATRIRMPSPVPVREKV